MDDVPTFSTGKASEMTRDLQGARSAFEERMLKLRNVPLVGRKHCWDGREESGHQIGITIERDHMRTDAFMFGVIVPCLLLSCSTSFLNSSVDIVPSAVGKFFCRVHWHRRA